jgi:hypothetical protein
VCILAITWFSIITNALETHRNMVRLKGIAHYACDVEVMREGDVVKVRGHGTGRTGSRSRSTTSSRSRSRSSRSTL